MKRGFYVFGVPGELGKGLVEIAGKEGVPVEKFIFEVLRLAVETGKKKHAPLIMVPEGSVTQLVKEGKL